MKNEERKNCKGSFESENIVPYLVPDLQSLFERKKLNKSVANELSVLGVEQEWVYRFYKNHNKLPTLEQSKKIKESFVKRKLTLAELNRIMELERIGIPKKIVFKYEELEAFFEAGIEPQEIKLDIIKLLNFWKNKRNI